VNLSEATLVLKGLAADK